MKLKAWQKIALWIVGLPLLLVLLLAALPTHDEPVIPDADLKVGAPARGAAGGLQVPMPQPVANSANPSTPQKVELGRLLFFDATLSTNNQLACASCHNPALGFTDGQPLAQGSVTLTRNTPALYGVAYSQNFFWKSPFCIPTTFWCPVLKWRKWTAHLQNRSPQPMLPTWWRSCRRCNN